MMSVYSEDQTCMKRILMDAKKWHSLPIRRLMRHSCDQAFSNGTKDRNDFTRPTLDVMSLHFSWWSAEVRNLREMT